MILMNMLKGFCYEDFLQKLCKKVSSFPTIWCENEENLPAQCLQF